MAEPVKPMTAAQFKSKVAEVSGKTAKEVDEVFKASSEVIAQQLRVAGAVTIPGIVKLTAKKKPATAARDGIDPFTKLPKHFPAKPASTTARATVLKAVKDTLA